MLETLRVDWRNFCVGLKLQPAIFPLSKYVILFQELPAPRLPHMCLVTEDETGLYAVSLS